MWANYKRDSWYVVFLVTQRFTEQLRHTEVIRKIVLLLNCSIVVLWPLCFPLWNLWLVFLFLPQVTQVKFTKNIIFFFCDYLRYLRETFSLLFTQRFTEQKSYTETFQILNYFLFLPLTCQNLPLTCTNLP